MKSVETILEESRDLLGKEIHEPGWAAADPAEFQVLCNAYFGACEALHRERVRKLKGGSR